MRPVFFVVNCVFDGRMFGPQRRDTLICWHSEPPMSLGYPIMLAYDAFFCNCVTPQKGPGTG
jgi:hypothetical protein